MSSLHLLEEYRMLEGIFVLWKTQLGSILKIYKAFLKIMGCAHNRFVIFVSPTIEGPLDVGLIQETHVVDGEGQGFDALDCATWVFIQEKEKV